MMFCKRYSRLITLLLVAALVWFAAAQNRRLGDARRAGMPEAPAYATQAPPFLNFITVGLGGFRGLAAEVLWARADRLQEDGRYFELVQLYAWITGLDPHATETWTYSAMTMAYDISVMMHRPADRQRWVSNGIQLLRDHGLPANPHSAKLHRTLAELYLYKISGREDTDHLTYKLSVVKEMAPFVNADGTVADTSANRTALAALRLDVDRMRQLERKFGPLDWRIAASHAVYWASLGLEYARDAECLACRRAIYQPLILCVQAGRFDGNAAKGEYHASPNPAIIQPALQFLQETLRESPTRGVRTATAFFLLNAIRQSVEHRDPAQAESLLRELNHIGEGAFRPMTLDAILQGKTPEMLQ